LTAAQLFGAAGQVRAADSYPDKPIRLEVGFVAGGATDLLARELAKRLSMSLNQSVIVENRGGAGGSIAVSYVAKAPPDGYTLLYSSAAIASDSATYKTLPYDPVHDFEPITRTFDTTYVVLVSDNVPTHDLKEFIDYAKSRKGMVTMATGGVGSSGHLGGIAFAHAAGIDVSYVPYKGTGEKVRDLISGEVQSTVDSITAYVSYIKEGKLRALCVGDLKRSPLLPDTPTCDEAGLKGLQVNSWHGVLAPKGTPAPIVALLNEKINAILHDPQVAKEVQPLGSTPTGGTPAQFREYIQQQIAGYRELAHLAGIEPQ
jgi:tripartite-type tricarboxylate transporter receptor subunit TctC